MEVYLNGSYLVPQNNSVGEGLTHKQLDIYGFLISTVATDALALKHQVISTIQWIISIFCTGLVSYKKYHHNNE